MNNASTRPWGLSNVLTGEPKPPLPAGVGRFPPASVRVPVAVDTEGRPTFSGAAEGFMAAWVRPRGGLLLDALSPAHARHVFHVSDALGFVEADAPRGEQFVQR